MCFQGQPMPNAAYQQQGRPGPQGYQAQNPLLRSNSPSVNTYTPAPQASRPPAPATSMAPNQHPHNQHPPQNEAHNQPHPPSAPAQTPRPSHRQCPPGTKVWMPKLGMPPPGKSVLDVLSKGEIRVALDNLKRSKLDPNTAARQRTMLKRRLAQLEAEEE